MGVPTSEVGYTSAMPRREDHEVHKDMWWHGKGRKKKIIIRFIQKFIVFHHFLEHVFLLSAAVRTSYVGKKSAVCGIPDGSQCEVHCWSRYD